MTLYMEAIRSTVLLLQTRTTSIIGLALLCIESELAKTIDYDSIIDTFAARKDRKAAL